MSRRFDEIKTKVYGQSSSDKRVAERLVAVRGHVLVSDKVLGEF